PLFSCLLRRSWWLNKPRFQASFLSPSTGAAAGGKLRRRRWWCAETRHIHRGRVHFSHGFRFCHCLAPIQLPSAGG
ncbi:hypothetical protein PIB30_065638, partial [Stylosanthes scabra]|nr:hypothetical protein [Stylosanthes scabra]